MEANRILRAYAARLLAIVIAVILFILVIWFVMKLIQGSPVGEVATVDDGTDSTVVVEQPARPVASENGTVASDNTDQLPNTGPAETFAALFSLSLITIFSKKYFDSRKSLHSL